MYVLIKISAISNNFFLYIVHFDDIHKCSIEKGKKEICRLVKCNAKIGKSFITKKTPWYTNVYSKQIMTMTKLYMYNEFNIQNYAEANNKPWNYKT